ncbi:MAG: GAF domain-containing protein [Verrucomicrobia bacterium]|nr:GAF domain-containing protein [Verrucomicrobiota bacterium]
MKPAPIPDNEPARLEALRQYQILDTAPEQTYDDITKLVTFICGTPMAQLSLVDKDRQWFKSKIGLDESQTPRGIAFCAHTILQTEPLIVNDATLDERFRDNPLVTEPPHVRFYAGVPLVNPKGFALGSLCAVDRHPRQLNPGQIAALAALGRQVVMLFELRRVAAELAETAAQVKTLSGILPICAFCKRIRDDEGYWEQVEAYVTAHTGAWFSHGYCPECARKHYPGFSPAPAT